MDSPAIYDDKLKAVTHFMRASARELLVPFFTVAYASPLN